ncbi:MAG: 2-hydroxychromene-2-carboxylate isomerase [Rhodocyclales bacterium]|nr:2-hydroxychromene-2-carboxylate isomerase [Rhodocyclales bacterium]
MKSIDFHFDFISPYAYLGFEALPQALAGLSCQVNYKPVLFAALLKHHGQLGPAEIADKRDWTYRQVQWLAHINGLRLDLPAAHPFNPLPLLRLALATVNEGDPGREACAAIFEHVWQGGEDAADPQRIAELTRRLNPLRDPAGGEVKVELGNNTDAAIRQGLFGVPAFTVDDKSFWGFDSLPMLRAWLQGDPWFAGGAWEAPGKIAVGAARRRP